MNIISWFMNLVGLSASWYFTSLESESLIQSTLCPILVTVFLIALLVKFVFLIGPDGLRGRNGSGFFGGSGGIGGDSGDSGSC